MKSGGDDRRQYWKLRGDLSNRMQALLKSVEERWLGSSRSFLLGSFVDPANRATVEAALGNAVQMLSKTSFSPVQKAELRCVLSAAGVLRPEELRRELRHFCRQETNATIEKVLGMVQSRLQMLKGRRNPVILILDSQLQMFPWESIPALYESRQPVSRVPSLQFLR